VSDGSLQDRVAEVLREHAATNCWWKCDDGTKPLSEGWHPAHVAARVIAALNLTEERHDIIDPHWTDWNARVTSSERRWVTGWEPS
jgi:hypothetical protein